MRRLTRVAPLVAALLALTLSTGCRPAEPPPVAPGTVIQVEPIKNRGPAVFVTVRYANGTTARYRLARGVCLLGQRYPDCADDG